MPLIICLLCIRKQANIVQMYNRYLHILYNSAGPINPYITVKLIATEDQLRLVYMKGWVERDMKNTSSTMFK